MRKYEDMHNARFHPSILREYDIRGIMGQTLFEKDAYWIGRCFGHVVKEKAGKAIAVARDGRLSSPQLESSLMKGLCDAGLDVYHLEIGPTPMLYFAEYTLPVDAAIMVTGSHNPPSHNGFKMSLQRKPFFGKDIAAFSQLITESLHKGQGKIYASNLLALYIDRLLQNLQLADKLKVVWDSGNGATGDILKNLIPQLPGHHILLNAEIDGNFPAHPPDPSDPVNLRELQRVVIEEKYDLGIAFDGDGDRLAAVDGRGRILWGDQLLLLFANDLLKRNPNATVIADVKTSQGFFDEITHLGGQTIMWKTGHSHIKAKMAESRAMLAGEMSGHFFFKEYYYGFDDGIYAAMRLLNLLSSSSQNLSEFYDGLPCLYSTPEIRISCNPEQKFKIPQDIKLRLLTQGYSFTDLDGIRVQLIEGWWLLRASHTQDVLVARCESYTKAGLERVKQHLKDELTIEHVLKAGASTCEFEQKIHLFSGKLHILV